MAVELVVKPTEGTTYEKGFIISIDKPMFWGHKAMLPTYIIIRVEDLEVADVSYLASEQILTDCKLSQVGDEIKIESGSATASGKNQIDTAKVGAAVLDVVGFGRTFLTETSVTVDVSGLPGDAMAVLEATIIDRLNKVYSERRYYFDNAEIDKIILSNESQIEMTATDFWSKIKDKMDE